MCHNLRAKLLLSRNSEKTLLPRMRLGRSLTSGTFTN
jgi:hypothetical protein